MKQMDVREQVAALVDEKLVALLDRIFPLKNPKPGLSMDEILYDAGCRRVVEWLRDCIEKNDSAVEL